MRPIPFWLWILLAAIALTGVIVYLADLYPGVLRNQDSRVRLGALMAWFGLLAGSVLMHARARPKSALRHAAIWVAIGLVLIVGYSYRDLLTDIGERVRGEIAPAEGIAAADGSVGIRAGADGHFRVAAEVDGVRIVFLVDTGASHVALAPADALALGFDPERLDYTDITSTANGTGRSAPVRLGSIAIGPIQVHDVRAGVNEAEMDESLLGMSFLGRLSGYAVEGDRLTLRP